VKAVISGAGAAGTAVAKMLLNIGVRDIVVCDSHGIISMDRFSEFGEDKMELLEITNKDNLTGTLIEAVRGRDLFVGVSRPGVLNGEMVRMMNADPVIFAMSNPEPEILPEIAKASGARIVGTGRSDFPNQINNVLVFPGIFRGALDAEARDITENMKVAAAFALAGLVSDEELSEDYVLPPAFRPGVAAAIAAAVAAAWKAQE
jgi:malate dehydrogenase (oxaloacetate-decarboxylating)